MNESARGMMIIDAKCWQCDRDMLVALIGDEAGNLDGGPEGFSEEEKNVAEGKGVSLKIVSSKTADDTYLANVCKGCGAFIGPWYFFAHYYTPALYGHYKYERVPIV